MSIPKKVIVNFTSQFANLIEAGIPLRKSIQILAQQSESPEFIDVIHGINEQIENGNSVSQSFGHYPEVFSQFYISMIYAGETGSGISHALKDLAEYMTKEEGLKDSLKKAFTYPILLLSMASLLVVFMVLVIVPVFEKVYKGMGVDLPLPTQMVVILSLFARKFWLPTVIGIGIFVFFYQTRLKKSMVFKGAIDHAILNAPLVGKLFRKVAAGRFIRTMGDLLIAGVPILEALDIAGKVSNNIEVLNVTKKIQKSIEGGGTFAKPLEESEFFPPLVVQMSYAGEEAGTLGEMLKKCAFSLDYEIDTATTALAAVLEPVITVAVGGLIGFIMLAIYLPMFDMVKMVGKK